MVTGQAEKQEGSYATELILGGEVNRTEMSRNNTGECLTLSVNTEIGFCFPS